MRTFLTLLIGSMLAFPLFLLLGASPQMPASPTPATPEPPRSAAQTDLQWVHQTERLMGDRQRCRTLVGFPPTAFGRWEAANERDLEYKWAQYHRCMAALGHPDEWPQ